MDFLTAHLLRQNPNSIEFAELTSEGHPIKCIDFVLFGEKEKCFTLPSHFCECLSPSFPFFAESYLFIGNNLIALFVHKLWIIWIGTENDCLLRFPSGASTEILHATTQRTTIWHILHVPNVQLKTFNLSSCGGLLCVVPICRFFCSRLFYFFLRASADHFMLIICSKFQTCINFNPFSALRILE